MKSLTHPILLMDASNPDMSYPSLDRTFFPNSLWKMFIFAAFSPVWDLSPPPVAWPSTFSNTHLGSNILGSILSGDTYPWQTRNISADWLRLAVGFTACTDRKNCFATHRYAL